MKLFGVNVSGLIHKYVSPGVFDAVLTKVTPGTRTPGAETSGTNPTTVDYPCRGFIDSQKQDPIKGTLSPDGTKKIILIGDSIASGAVPEIADRVTIESATYEVMHIDRDPAAATYTLTCTKK